MPSPKSLGEGRINFLMLPPSALYAGNILSILRVTELALICKDRKFSVRCFYLQLRYLAESIVLERATYPSEKFTPRDSWITSQMPVQMIGKGTVIASVNVSVGRCLAGLASCPEYMVLNASFLESLRKSFCLKVIFLAMRAEKNIRRWLKIAI